MKEMEDMEKNFFKKCAITIIWKNSQEFNVYQSQKILAWVN